MNRNIILKISFLYFVTLLLIPIGLICQPIIEWENNFGSGIGDGLESIIQTSDGLYVAAGNVGDGSFDVEDFHDNAISPGNDIWIIKINEEGEIIWQRTIGGTESENALKVVETYDSGFVIAGYSDSPDGDIIGLHYEGFVEDFDGWIGKLDSTGALEWNMCYGSIEWDGFYDIIQTTDSGFIAVGTATESGGDVSNHYGGEDAWVVKVDMYGNLIWEQNFGGTESDLAQSITQYDEETYIIAGTTNSDDGDIDNDFWTNNYVASLWAIDTAGNLQWQKSYGGLFGDDVFNSVKVTEDGKIVAVGSTESDEDTDVGQNNGFRDIWVVVLDNQQEILWERCFGYTSTDVGKYVDFTEDGNIIIGGNFVYNGDVLFPNHHGASDFYVLKLDITNGNIIWEGFYGGSSTDRYVNEIHQTTDGGFILGGNTLSNDGDVSELYDDEDDFLAGEDWWVVKLFPYSVSSFKENDNLENKVELFPTPTCDKIEITNKFENDARIIQILDASGRCIKDYDVTVSAGETEILYVADLTQGVYFLRLEISDTIVTKRVVISCNR